MGTHNLRQKTPKEDTCTNMKPHTRWPPKQHAPPPHHAGSTLPLFCARPKRRVQQGVLRNVYQTYLTSKEVTFRWLRWALVHQRCISSTGELQEAPDVHLPHRRLLHTGLPVTRSARTPKHGLLPCYARTCLCSVLSDESINMLTDLFEWLCFVVFRSARVPGCELHSKAATGHRMWTSSFTWLQTEHLIVLSRDQQPLQGCRVCYVRCYFQRTIRMTRTQSCHDPEAETDHPKLLAADMRQGELLLSNMST